MSEPTNGVSKKGKKRRSLSCATCRKLKTRCDFDAEKRMCHRCYMLRLPCSLMNEPPPITKKEAQGGHMQLNTSESISAVTAPAAVDTVASASSSTAARRDQRDLKIESLEKNVTRMASMMENMQKMLTNINSRSNNNSPMDSSTISSNNNDSSSNRSLTSLVGSQYDDSAPLVVIREIDYKLFGRHERYEPVREASVELCAWINDRVGYCDQMAQIFKSKCASYLISDQPISSQTPLLAGIMTLQGMRCDEKSTHDEQQLELFIIVRRVLSTVLMTSPLHVGDIEAMLYMAMFNPARKPKQPIFDSWLLTSYGAKMFIVSVPFDQVLKRIEQQKQLEKDDLYLIRLWNGLCLCHLQYAIASGKPILISSDHLEICSLVSKIPQLESSQDIYVAAEIELLIIQSRLQRDRVNDDFDIGDDDDGSAEEGRGSSSFTGNYPELDSWQRRYWQFLDLDPLQSLNVGLEYCRVVLACRYLRRYTDTKVSNNNTTTTPSATSKAAIAYQNAVQSSSSIIRRFLDLSPAKIEAMPNHPLCQLIYAALTLCRYINIAHAHGYHDRHATLNLITRIYWYLYHIGDQPRDIVHSISNIIKSLVETAPAEQSNSQQQTQPPPPLVQVPQPQPLVTAGVIAAAPNAAAAAVTSGPQLPEAPAGLASGTSTAEVVTIEDIPDISQYSTYDEFFEGVFSYMQAAGTAGTPNNHSNNPNSNNNSNHAAANNASSNSSTGNGSVNSVKNSNNNDPRASTTSYSIGSITSTST